MTIREILRDAPAGQLARIYLGWKIAPYEDEKEGYQLPYDVSASPYPDDHSAEILDEMEKDKDLESNAVNSEAAGPAGQYIEHIPTTNEKPDTLQTNYHEVKFSPMDRDNPQNWGAGKKAFSFFQIILLTFTSQHTHAQSFLNTDQIAVYSASAIITPAEGVFEEHWGTTEQVSSLVLSMYVLGRTNRSGLNTRQS